MWGAPSPPIAAITPTVSSAAVTNAAHAVCAIVTVVAVVVGRIVWSMAVHVAVVACALD